MKRIFLVLTLILICTVLNARALKVGIYENKPLVYIDDKKEPKGLFVDVLTHIAEKENWEIEYVYQSWADCLRLLEKDSIDILVDIAYTEKRTEIFDYNKENVFVNWGIVYVNDQSISTMLDLNRKTIAGVKDDLYFEELILLLKKFDVVFEHIYVNEYAEGLKMLEDKKVDAAVVNRLFGSLNESNYQIQKSEIIFRPSELRYASPKYKMQSVLTTIDYYIKEMKQDENSIYYQSINEHISGVKSVSKNHNHKISEKFLIITLSITSFVLFVLFIYLLLKRKGKLSIYQHIKEINENYPYPWLIYNNDKEVIKTNQSFKQHFNFIEEINHFNLNDLTEQYNELTNLSDTAFRTIKIKHPLIKQDLSVLIVKVHNLDNHYQLYFLDNISLINTLSDCASDNNLLNDVFTNLPDIHLLFNEDGTILKVNNLFLDLINENDNHNILPNNIIDLFNPGIITQVKNHFSKNRLPFVCDTDLTINSHKNNHVKIIVNNFINNMESYYVLTISNLNKQGFDFNSIKKMIKDIPYPVLIAQNSSTILFVNSMFCDLFGINSEDVLDKKIHDLFSNNTEQTWINQDYIWSEVNVKVQDSTIKLLQIFKMEIPIDTLRKISVLIFRETLDFELSLKQYLYQLKQYDKILAANSDFIIMLNLKNEVLYVSTSLNMIKGFENVKITNNAEILKQICSAEDYNMFSEILFCNNSNMLENNTRIRLTDLNKNDRYFEIVNHRTEILSNSIRIILLHEVSQYQNEIQMMNKQITELHDLLDHMNDMLICVNQNGDILYSNLYFSEKSGLRKEEIIGKRIFELINISNHEVISNELLMSSEFNKSLMIHDCRIEFINSEKRFIEHMSVSLTKFKDKDGKTFILVMIKDLSYIIKMQKELLKLKNLEILQKSSLHIANDFNNILTAIMGHIALLKLSPDIPASMLDRIKKAEEASIKAKELTQKIFPLEHKSHLKRDYFSISLLLEQIEFKKPDNIQFKFDIPDGLSPVYVEKEMTISAISKILENAYESMPAGGIISIVVKETEMLNKNIYSLIPGNYISIKICDKGNGIDSLYLEKVYEPYFSLKNKEGLGLTQAFHQLITQNAYTKLTSVLHEGTCVEIFLPQRPASQHIIEPDKHFDKTIKILFMDDEQLVLDIALEYLNKLGFQVVLVRMGKRLCRYYPKIINLM